MEEYITKTVMPNGLTIVTEHIPSVKSVTAGIWVKSGADMKLNNKQGLPIF